MDARFQVPGAGQGLQSLGEVLLVVVVKRGQVVGGAVLGQASDLGEQGVSVLTEVQGVLAPVAGRAGAGDRPAVLQVIDQGDQGAGQHPQLGGDGLLGAARLGRDRAQHSGVGGAEAQRVDGAGEGARCLRTDLGEQEHDSGWRWAHPHTIDTLNRSCYELFMVHTTARPQHGPSLGALAVVTTVLTLAAPGVATALGGALPPPSAGAGAVAAYVTSHPGAAKATGVLTLAAAVPLALYGATAASRLRRLGVTAPGATIASTGGTLAAAMTAAGGVAAWTLAQPGVGALPALAAAIDAAAFAASGPAVVVFTGLLTAGIAVPALIMGLLPRPLAWTGLVIAAICQLSLLALIWPSAIALVPLGRFAALTWLIAAGFALPHHPPHHARPAAQPHPGHGAETAVAR